MIQPYFGFCVARSEWKRERERVGERNLVEGGAIYVVGVAHRDL